MYSCGGEREREQRIGRQMDGNRDRDRKIDREDGWVGRQIDVSPTG